VTETLDRLQAALGDRYRVERELGAGGMATVFLAQDIKHDREVAIKVLHPELAASIGSERFDREIRLAAKLQHPHILGLYDSGAANGLLYYVMPFVKGESLRDRLNREQQLPIDDAIQVALEVADALGYAHEHGVVHRDIKPENILLAGGHALVADFGIARAAASADTQKLTQTGVAIGTPLYMSPEQSVGENVGPTADIYSLGCVLYEMLAGTPPFTGPNARAIMARHAMTPVPGLQEVRASVPDEVEEAVMAALAKVPADRPQTAKQFCEIMGTPIGTTSTRRAGLRQTGTRHPSVRITAQQLAATREVEAYVPVAFWRRRAVWATAVLVFVVAGALGYWRFRAGRPAGGVLSGPDPNTIAVLYFEDQSASHDLAYLADGLTEGLIAALSEVSGLTVVSKGGSAQFRGKSVPRDSIARALKVGTLVEGSVEQEKDQVRVTVRLVDASSGAEFQRASFEAPASAYLTLSDSLAQQAAGFLRQRLGVEVRLREQRSRTKSTDAWVLLQRAEQARKAAEAAAAVGDSTISTLRFSEADSIAKLAAEKDPSWNEPLVFRGRIAYRRSRLAVASPGQASTYIDQGMGFANTAVGRDNADPDALELRGTLEYWKWLLRLVQDPAAAKALFASARKDLEAATRINPAQAGAWGSLSHLYGLADNAGETDIVLAARRAYESDAYLENAPKIIERLFNGYYDLDQAVDASHWCDEGYRRFPDNGIFTTCQLYVMTMRGQTPDPAKAWRLANSQALATDPSGGSPELEKRDARLMVAAVLARAGLKDSAKAVARDGTAGTDVDPTRFLYMQQSFALLLAGDKPGAIAALKVFLAANPDRRRAFAEDPGWRFRELASDPAFKDLVGAQ
jgi:eukaryotic-like serine/threonine-protein kinase